MSSNKKAKEELMKYYGSECFIDKLNLRKDSKRIRYTSKAHRAKMKQLTYHHIKMKKDGGRATRENGALLSAENHTWFHKQSPQAQGYMNAIFQEYKRQVDLCAKGFIDQISFDLEISPTEFCAEDYGPKKEKYNRAKEKEKVRRMLDDYYASQTSQVKSEQKNAGLEDDEN